MHYTEKQIKDWCEANLFGKRTVEGVKLELSPTQKGVMSIAIEIIQKWENSKQKEKK